MFVSVVCQLSVNEYHYYYYYYFRLSPNARICGFNTQPEYRHNWRKVYVR